MKRIIIFVLALSSTCYCLPQSKLWENIKIRKSFESGTDDDNNPANLSFAFPEDKSNYYIINAGVGYEFGHSSTGEKRKFDNSFTVYFVYNRNNQIDKEQSNIKFGTTANQIFYLNEDPVTAIFADNSFGYLRDFQNVSNSLLVTSYWSPLLKKNDFLKLGGYAVSDSPFAYYILPRLGLEFQHRFSAKNDDNNGSDLRGFFGLELSFLFKKNTSGSESKYIRTKCIELKTAYDGRQSIIKNVDNQTWYSSMFKTELQVYPLKEDNFSIGLSYNKGTSPIDGLEKQGFWLLAFRYKK